MVPSGFNFPGPGRVTREIDARTRAASSVASGERRKATPGRKRMTAQSGPDSRISGTGTVSATSSIAVRSTSGEPRAYIRRT